MESHNILRNSEYLSQTFSQKSSQTLSKQSNGLEKQKCKNDETEKASWDKKSTLVFVTLCVDEVRSGNRPGTHFNRPGWENLVRIFNLATNRNYTRKQLKNHWDNLRRGWREWKTLLRNETGLGWDNDKETVDASDEWWARKIKQSPEVAKFKEKGPFSIAEQEFLFDDVIATGERVWVPISGVLPRHMRDDEYSEEERSEPHESPTTNLDASNTVEPSATEGVGSNLKRKTPFSSFIHKKSRKANTGEILANSFATVVDHIKNKQASANYRPAAQYTIKECVDVLDKMDGIEEGDEKWLFATDLFLDHGIQELFLSMKKDETRLIWLEKKMEKVVSKKTSFSMTSEGSDGSFL